MRIPLKEATASLRREVAVYRIAARDPRTPWLSRALLGVALAYLASPIDLIPDFIPVIGHLDDLVIVPSLVILALRLMPADVLTDARHRIQSE